MELVHGDGYVFVVGLPLQRHLPALEPCPHQCPYACIANSDVGISGTATQTCTINGAAPACHTSFPMSAIYSHECNV